MAAGDLGSLISISTWLTGTASRNQICKVADGIYAIANETGSGSGGVVTVQTYSISPAGVIAAIDSQVLTPLYCAQFWTSLIHVSGTVYAILIKRTTPFTGHWVITLNIGDDGIIGSEIVVTSVSTEAEIPVSHLLYVGGTTYAYSFMRGTNSRHAIRTISISTNGLVIASVDLLEVDVTIHSYRDAFVKVAPNIYLSLRTDATWGTKVNTYSISNAGIVDNIANVQIDPAGGGDSNLSAVKVATGVWAFSYGVTTTRRLRTVVVNDDGTIGANIDVDDVVLAGGNWPQHAIQVAWSQVFLYVSQQTSDSALLLQTINIAADGTIGAVQDTLAGPGAQDANTFTLGYVSGNIYQVTFFRSGGSNGSYVRTFDVENPAGVTYPADSTVRVGGLRHIYRPGSYRLEGTLGGISTDVELAQRVFEEPSVAPAGIQPTPAPYAGPAAALPPPTFVQPVQLPPPGMPGYPIAVPGYPLPYPYGMDPETARELQKALAEVEPAPQLGPEIQPEQGFFGAVIGKVTETVTNWWQSIFGTGEEE